MGNYVYEVIRCHGSLVFWQMEQPILLFINYVNVTDVRSQSQMLLVLIIYCCHFPQHYHLLLGKTFSFTPDEAKFEDLAKTSVPEKYFFCY